MMNSNKGALRRKNPRLTHPTLADGLEALAAMPLS
jgi:hypothetical protein